jgi:hypothetical protein
LATMAFTMSRIGMLERTLLPHQNLSYGTKTILTEDDTHTCSICKCDFEDDLAPLHGIPSTLPSPAANLDSHERCRPIRLSPCGHVIGQHCFNIWLREARQKKPVCLQCTCALDIHPEEGTHMERIARWICRSSAIILTEFVIECVTMYVAISIVAIVLLVLIFWLEASDLVCWIWGHRNSGKQERERSGRRTWTTWLGMEWSSIGATGAF